VEVPECQDIAARVLLLQQLSEVLPPGQECRMADEGGILYFTSSTQSGSSAERSKCKAAAPPEFEPKVNASGSWQAVHADLLDLSDAAAGTAPEPTASDTARAPHAACPSNSPSPPSSALRKMSVAELRREMELRGLSAKGCLEKSDLVERIMAAAAAGTHLLDIALPSESLTVPAKDSKPEFKAYTRDMERFKDLVVSIPNPESTSEAAAPTHQLPEVYRIADVSSPNMENAELCRAFNFDWSSARDTSHCGNNLEGLPSASSKTKAGWKSRPPIPLATDAYMREQIPRQRDPFDFVAAYVASA